MPIKLKDIPTLSANAFDNDVRALAAFGAIETPTMGKDFELGVIQALSNLDWKGLLKIAFQKPLNQQQSQEFMDTVINLCDDTQKADMSSYLKKSHPNAANLIHPDFKNQFLTTFEQGPNIALSNFLQNEK